MQVATQNPAQQTLLPPPLANTKIATTGVNTEESQSFRHLVAPKEQTQDLKFDNSEEAAAAAALRKEQMQKLNTGSITKIIESDDLDKEFSFLTNLIIEDFKNPDPTQERDHSEHTRTMVALISAGEQAQMSKLMREQNNLIKHQNRLSVEARIGKKVQYQDSFFEVREESDTIPIYYRLGRDAHFGQVKILDASGHIVQEIILNKLQKGDHRITWDLSLKGDDPHELKAAPGTYFIEFEALDRDETPVENIVELEGLISDIDSDDKGMPEYYVAGIKIDGRITKVSQPLNDISKMAHALRKINSDYRSGKAIEPIKTVQEQQKLIDMDI